MRLYLTLHPLRQTSQQLSLIRQIMLFAVMVLIPFASVWAASAANCGSDYNSARNNYGGFYNSPNKPNLSAFAALKADGSIVAWGDKNYGGSGAPTGTGFVSIASNNSAFAALKADGSIVAWGNSGSGGSGAPTGMGFVSIASNYSAFAALKADGSIVAWGNSNWGGSGAPTDKGFVSIASAGYAFAALKTDGSIAAWGDSSWGGSGTPTDKGFVSISSNDSGFAALRANGSITAWGGFGGRGGAPTDKGFVSISSNYSSFAALKADGSITAWGYSDWGGSGAPTDKGFVSIASNHYSFAALKADGSIIAWGDKDHGVSGMPTDKGFVHITSNDSAFAALKTDGSIITWGDKDHGGSGAPTDKGFVSIASASRAFAALKADGSIAVWGDSSFGGSGAPTGIGFVSIASTGYGFAALKGDGSIAVWHGTTWGGIAPTGTGFVSINGVGPNTPTDCRFTLKINAAPVITSNSGKPLAVTMPENSMAVTDINASDAEDGGETKLKYSLSGTDSALLQIATDGKLTFKAAPDFEKPVQKGSTPNVYSLSVTVTDSAGLTATQAITITVTDVVETAPINITSNCGLDYSSAQNNYGGFYNSPNIPSNAAFAALKADGSIVAWGNTTNGGIATSVPTDKGFVSIASTSYAFAALKADGSITTWGRNELGGSGSPTDTGFVSISSTHDAFAALKADGSIAAWGRSDLGGSGAPTDKGFVSIASNSGAFAALKADGSIVAWGGGGSGAPTGTGFVSIASSNAAFAALKADGSIAAWGDSSYGGSGAPTGTGFVSIASNMFAFAALKADGTIAAWGDGSYGGSGAPTGKGFVSITSSDYAFAALKADGSIVTWGDSTKGGSGAPTSIGFVRIASNGWAFAALKADGSIVAWGDSVNGGSGAPTEKGFVRIASNYWSFAALKADGSIVAWGRGDTGGSGAPTSTGFVSIASNGWAFAALKADGSIVAWGRGDTGGSGAPTGTGFVSINGVSPNTPTDCRFTLKANAAPVITSNSGKPLAVTMPENSTAVTDINASDAEDGGETKLKYSLSGTDSALLQITTDGKLTFKVAPDFEKSAQKGSTPNVYSLSVTVTDSAGLTATQAITITVTDVVETIPNAPPTFTSSNKVSFAENGTGTVTDINATDDKDSEGKGLTYQMDNSAASDNALFNVVTTSGVLTFKVAPDYEIPTDTNKDNAYTVMLKACDSSNACTTQVVVVTVTDVVESSVASALEYSIRRDTGSNRYRVYMRPKVTPAKNFSTTGQITLKVPHGTGNSRFVISDLKSAISGVTWTQSSRSDAPLENSASDYLSFTFSPEGSNAFAWKAGQELEVFNFANTSSNCSGVVSVMANTDAFNTLPNSRNTNPGNQFNNLGWGAAGENHYAGNYGTSPACTAEVNLKVRALLQGAYNSTDKLMSDKLRSGKLIPVNQPYNAIPWAYKGGETLSSTVQAMAGQDAPVDWVLVELRDATTPKTIVTSQAAIVQRDGDIVDAASGSTDITLKGVNAGNYYVNVRHRNHLGVMSKTALALASTQPATMVDFTQPATAVYGVNARLDNTTVSMLWAGDIDANNSIITSGSSNDINLILGAILAYNLNTDANINYSFKGYYSTDVNMDGQTLFAGPNNDVTYLIGNVLLHPGNTNFASNYIINGNLPKSSSSQNTS